MRHILALLLFSLVFTTIVRADDERHWTTNGVHRGVISHTESKPVFDTNGFAGTFTVSYMLETLMGEPVEDEVFFWKWPEGNAWDSLVVGTAKVDGKPVEVHVRDLQKYPDLLADIQAAKPYEIELNLRVEFMAWDNTTRRWESFATATKTIKPILIGQSGEKMESLAPGSPNWADWFNRPVDNQFLYTHTGMDPEKMRAEYNKDLYRRAEHIELTFGYPAIKRIQWSGLVLWQSLLEKYGERESKPVQTTNQVSLATNTPANPKLATGPNPFEQASEAARKTPNPFEQASGQPVSTPNPFETASAGISSTVENPFEKSARLEAEEQARQEAIRQEDARKAEIARQEQAAEDARQAELARQESAQGEADQPAEPAHGSEPPGSDGSSSYDENDAFHRAVRQQNREIAAERSRQNSSGYNFMRSINQDVNTVINAGRPPSRNYGGAVDPSTVVAYPAAKSPSSSQSGSGDGLTLAVTKTKTYHKVYDVQCPECNGTGRCHVCKGSGKSGVIVHKFVPDPTPGGTVITADSPGHYEDIKADCGSCNGTGKCDRCKGTGILAGKYRLVEDP